MYTLKFDSGPWISRYLWESWIFWVTRRCLAINRTGHVTLNTEWYINCRLIAFHVFNLYANLLFEINFCQDLFFGNKFERIFNRMHVICKRYQNANLYLHCIPLNFLRDMYVFSIKHTLHKFFLVLYMQHLENSIVYNSLKLNLI